MIAEETLSWMPGMPLAVRPGRSQCVLENVREADLIEGVHSGGDLPKSSRVAAGRVHLDVSDQIAPHREKHRQIVVGGGSEYATNRGKAPALGQQIREERWQPTVGDNDG